MPAAFMVSREERDLVEEVWPEPGENDPKIYQGLLTVNPSAASAIVRDLWDRVDEDNQAARRFTNRLVDTFPNVFKASLEKTPEEVLPTFSPVEDLIEDDYLETVDDE